jgi:hypothetical protein
MKLKKIKLLQLENGSLSYKVMMKEFVNAISKMETDFNAVQNQVKFYICLEQDFDNGKLQNMLFAIGERNSKWKKYINKQVKDGKQKKKILYGTCFLEIQENGGKILQLTVEKGNAKLNKIIKGGKPLFKKTGLSIEVFSGVIEEDESEEQIIEENVDSKKEKSAPEKKLDVLIKSKAMEIIRMANGLSKIKDKKELIRTVYNIRVFRKALNSEIEKFDNLSESKEDSKKMLADMIPKLTEIDLVLKKHDKLFKKVDGAKKMIVELNAILEKMGEAAIKN